MLIVTGALTARPDNVDTFLEQALAHTRRSRAEDGCIHHQVARDCENPLRLVFFELWRDEAALQAHFKVPASIEFVTAIRRDAASSEGPDVYTLAV